MASISDLGASEHSAMLLLQKRELSAVVFVKGYLQFQFDGPVLTAWTWPVIVTRDGRIEPYDAGYRDALCARIGNLVTKTVEAREERLGIGFADEVWLDISLKDEDRTGPEAAMLMDESHKLRDVW